MKRARQSVTGAWRGWAAACLWLAGACVASGGEARRYFAEGEAALARGEDAAASEAFLQAAAAAEGEGLDGDVARFNALAVSLASGGELPDEAMGTGGKSPDLALRAALHYDRGGAWMAKASSAGAVPVDGADGAGVASLEELGSEKSLVARAKDEYREAVLLAPGVPEYQQNYELALARLNELEQMEQEQRQQQQDEQQDGDDQEQDEQEQQQESQQQEQQDQDQGEDGNSGEQQQQEQQEQGEQGEDSSDSEPQESEGESAGEPTEDSERMTEEEAELLLDRMRQHELQQRDAIRIPLGRAVPVEKDW